MDAHGDDLVGKRAEVESGAPARQQAAVAELGLKALANDDLRGLVHEAVVCVARTLGVEYAGRGSQAGYALLSDEPVVSDDVGAEERFRPPPLLVEHGVVGSMTVVIPGHGGAPMGPGGPAGERGVFPAG